ncbi:histidinol-phosphatase (PHP family) [Geosmithia morbida]|uniref:Histidinol-phosphatase n=1 Tax=Geosmithia morbida TaxID=1094350 RepID=A0A9P4YU20_9HYPO|nr:histidinol-phosphatase (PHP family) [Geosmithia morbida]KAF4123096.1 histidinol-phosphatase (PHP family) [Geosmithia morbida]
MAFTMHSHSGQFCPGHAKDQLEDIIQHAISAGFKTMGLTEHMPRYEERDLYPEEHDEPDALSALSSRHESYLIEAQRLQSHYSSQINILIGFEAEFIRPSFKDHVLSLVASGSHCIDYFIGSVHHVHGFPIDYDAVTYAAALDASGGGSEEGLYSDYYDLQYDMLTALRPRVVGHFDLIRLLSQDPARDVRGWDGVWSKIVRNLNLIKSQGGWLECNSAALRKGLAEPYPSRPIAELWVSMDGKFTMSDDSHGKDHIATNYSRALTYLESLGVTKLWTFQRKPSASPEGCATLKDTAVPISEFRKSFP